MFATNPFDFVLSFTAGVAFSGHPFPLGELPPVRASEEATGGSSNLAGIVAMVWSPIDRPPQNKHGVHSLVAFPSHPYCLRTLSGALFHRL
jgi:hypothetical protein